MLSFFRKIRKNLLNEGKTARYFKYAIGEIILVVLGILIALQINTWNQARIERNNESLYLLSIVSEIESNNEINKNVFWSRFEKKLDGLLQAKAFAEDRLEVKDPDKFIHSVTYGAVSSGGYDMGDDFVYDELVSSGNMNLLSDGKIKSTVNDYYASLKTRENRLTIHSSDFLSFISGIRPFDSENIYNMNQYDQDEAMVAFKTDEFRKMVDSEISYTYKLRDFLIKQEQMSIEIIGLIELKLTELKP